MYGRRFKSLNHHKVPEGAMFQCVDCHNPHGSISKAMTQTYAANDRGCVGCHGDKRGPFTFEHAPVRFEGCNSCHEPHGSVNPQHAGSVRKSAWFAWSAMRIFPPHFVAAATWSASFHRHFTT